MNKTTVNFEGNGHAVVDVWQPSGGRYVCDILLDDGEESIHLQNIHCDLAHTLRDALSRVLVEMGME